MSRWIDANALAYIVASNGDADFINKVTRLMIESPSIDIVRCGECKAHHDANENPAHIMCGYMSDDDCCSYGEREGE